MPLKQMCEFNGARDAGEERFDPRFDCTALAEWHILLAVGAGLTSDGAIDPFSCGLHLANVKQSIVLKHVVSALCYGEHTRWNLGRNRCEPGFPYQRRT